VDAGNVTEVSAAIVYLLSPAASFITGSCIWVDGGAPHARYCWNPPTPPTNSVPFEGFPLESMPRLLTEGVTRPIPNSRDAR